MSDKIALKLIFDGSAFHGWQVQKNAYSVQEAVQDTLEKLLGVRPDVSGCSRTDSGVHANEYVCHIEKDFVNIPTSSLAGAINYSFSKNKRLSGKIAVCDAQEKPYDFHARYSCIGKEYVYKIWNERYRNPFYEGRALFVPQKINEEKYHFLEDEFCGKHDFSSFVSKGCKNPCDTIRNVHYFKVTRNDNLLQIAVCADGFLYNMVRIMVGTYLKAVLKGAKKDFISDIIRAKERSFAGETAPAHGLYLNKVLY